jgi:cyclopropane-fatty-acyl-phospholipid synthase
MATTMTRHTQTGETPAGTRSERRLAGRLRSMVAADAASFALRFPSGYTVQVGARASDFCLDIRNDRGLRAVTSLDELRVCEAYMAADIDIEGDIRKAIGLREHLRDQNIWVTTWRHLQPLLHGRTKSNREWVSAHYDMDNLHLHFLDREYHTYTPGVFEHDDEPLEVASGRKLRLAFEGLGLKPGDRVLEPGPGWGSFIRYATRRGVYVKGITLSRHQLAYINEHIARDGWNADVEYMDFFRFEPTEQYDAIVLNGVIEELRDFPAVMERLARWIKPGKRVYLDFMAAREHFVFPAFISKYVYRGAVCRVFLPKLVEAITRSPFEMLAVHNDRRNYYLTARYWFENLERERDAVRARFGEAMYRLYRLYLGGTVNMLDHPTHFTTAYRIFLERPGDWRPL